MATDKRRCDRTIARLLHSACRDYLLGELDDTAVTLAQLDQAQLLRNSFRSSSRLAPANPRSGTLWVIGRAMASASRPASIA